MRGNGDIYTDLLGLADGPRPPDFYQLIGVPPFEADLRRINEATQQAIARVTSYLTGARADDAQKLLAEIATARAALTTPVVKARYDSRLRKQGVKRPKRSKAAGSGEMDDLLPPRAIERPVEQTVSMPLSELVSDKSPIAAPTSRPRTSAWAQTVTAPPPPPAAEQSAVPAPMIVTARLVSLPGAAFSGPPEQSPGMSAPPPLPDAPVELAAPPAIPGARLEALPPADNPARHAEFPLAPPLAADSPSQLPMMSGVRSAVVTASSERRRAQNTLIVGLASAVVILAIVAVSAVVWNVEGSKSETKNQAVARASEDEQADEAPERSEKQRNKGRGKNAGRKSQQVAKNAAQGKAVPVKNPRDKDAPTVATEQRPASPGNDMPKKEESAKTQNLVGKEPSNEATTMANKTAVDKSLVAAREAIARRDFDAADTQLDLALLDASTDELRLRVEGLKLLRHYVDRFWNAVSESLKTLEAGNEIPINGEPAVIVEVRPNGKSFIMRIKGQNRTFETQKLPPHIAVAFAERWLDKDDVNSKAFIGAFLALDERSDKQRARKVLSEAKAAGSEAAASILAELDR